PDQGDRPLIARERLGRVLEELPGRLQPPVQVLGPVPREEPRPASSVEPQVDAAEKIDGPPAIPAEEAEHLRGGVRPLPARLRQALALGYLPRLARHLPPSPVCPCLARTPTTPTGTRRGRRNASAAAGAGAGARRAKAGPVPLRAPAGAGPPGSSPGTPGGRNRPRPGRPGSSHTRPTPCRRPPPIRGTGRGRRTGRRCRRRTRNTPPTTGRSASSYTSGF